MLVCDNGTLRKSSTVGKLYAASKSYFCNREGTLRSLS